MIDIIKRISLKNKIVIGVYLVLLLVGIMSGVTNLTVYLLFAYPFILLYLLLYSEERKELDWFVTYMFFATLHVLFYIVYLFAYEVDRDALTTETIISIVFVVCSSVVLILVVPRFYYRVNKYIRRLIYVVFIVAFYSLALLLMWILAWAGAL